MLISKHPRDSEGGVEYSLSVGGATVSKDFVSRSKALVE
jgi:hypothetical protein